MYGQYGNLFCPFDQNHWKYGNLRLLQLLSCVHRLHIWQATDDYVIVWRRDRINYISYEDTVCNRTGT